MAGIIAEIKGYILSKMQGEFLSGLYTAVSGADDGKMLETLGGDLTLVDAPEGLSPGDAAWLTAASARVADGDDVATRDTDGTGGNLTVLDASGNAVDAGYGSSAFDAAGAAATAQAAAIAASQKLHRYDIRNYGAVVDGTTDDSAAVIAAIAAAYAAGGGTVYFPVGKTRVDSQIVLPNSVTGTPPTQKSIRLTGEVAAANGQSGLPQGGSQLDLRYSGDYGKIVTYGLGMLEIDHLILTDYTPTPSSDTPFILTTNTTLWIHHNQFYGSADKGFSTCDQDAILLGGVGSLLHTGNPDAPFQGYGTVIDTNFFDRIRRACFFRTYCANTSFVNNVLWQHCGSDATAAGLEFDGVNNVSGNYIAGNLIEMTARVYGIKLTNSNSNTFSHNSFTDAAVGAVALALIKIVSGGSNIIIGGFSDGYAPMFEDDSATPSTVCISAMTGGATNQTDTTWYTPVEFRNQVNLHNSSYGVRVNTLAGDIWRDFSPGTGQFDKQFLPGGGTAEVVNKILRTSASKYKHIFYGDLLNISTAKTPASAAATGTAGDIAWDTGFLYICTATNTWKRIPLIWPAAGVDFAIKGSDTAYATNALQIDNSASGRIVTTTNDGRTSFGAKSGNNSVVDINLSGAKTTGTPLTITAASYVLSVSTASMSTTSPNFAFGANGAGSAINMTAPSNYALTVQGNLVGVNTSTTTIGSQLQVNANAAGVIGQIIKLAATPTANALEVRSSGNSVLSALTSTGAFSPPSLADAAAANNTIYYSTTASKLVYKDPGGTVNALY